MTNDKLTFKILNLFAMTAMVAINILAQTLPLGGHTTAEISAMYPTLLTPAPITFSIWSVIYILLGYVVIRQLLTAKDEATEKMGWWFAISCGLNIAWIVFWHYQLLLFASVAIVGLWVALMMLSDSVKTESWLHKAAFRIYYGWITVAMAAQLYILLSANLPGLHTKTIALIITISAMVVLTAFGLAKVMGERDGFFGIAIAWALAGIFINHVGPGYNGMYLSIVLVSGIAALSLVAAIIYSMIRARKPKILPEAQ